MVIAPVGILSADLMGSGARLLQLHGESRARGSYSIAQNEQDDARCAPGRLFISPGLEMKG